ncbi:MAG: glycosyltransferase family 2 protein [Solirubrobacterales bacterium]
MEGSDSAVAVAVVSWNTRELLRRCLLSMQPYAEEGAADVWVVDNGSRDGSPEMVRVDFPWARLLEPGENLGFGRAVNLAARESGSQWIAASNADVELLPGSLEGLVQAMEADPAAGAAAPRLILPDGSTQHSVHRFPSPSLALMFGLAVHRLNHRIGDHLCLEGWWNPDRAREVDWAHGAFLLTRRKAFEQVGGFDESQWLYAEDIDLAWRLRKAGYRVRYVPDARVRHAAGAAARHAFGDPGRERRHMEATYVWLAKRRGVMLARLTAALNFAGAVLRLLPLSLLAPIWPARWGPARHRARRYLRLHGRGLREPLGLGGPG